MFLWNFSHLLAPCNTWHQFDLIAVINLYYSRTKRPQQRSGPYCAQHHANQEETVPAPRAYILNRQDRQRVRGDTKAQRRDVTCPKLHNRSETSPGIEARSSESRPRCLSPSASMPCSAVHFTDSGVTYILALPGNGVSGFRYKAHALVLALSPKTTTNTIQAAFNQDSDEFLDFLLPWTNSIWKLCPDLIVFESRAFVVDYIGEVPREHSRGGLFFPSSWMSWFKN